MPIMSIIIAVVVTLIVAVPITYFATVSKLKSDADSKIGNADTKAREIIDDALKTAEAKKKEAGEAPLSTVPRFETLLPAAFAAPGCIQQEAPPLLSALPLPSPSEAKPPFPPMPTGRRHSNAAL